VGALGARAGSARRREALVENGGESPLHRPPVRNRIGLGVAPRLRLLWTAGSGRTEDGYGMEVQRVTLAGHLRSFGSFDSERA
jgi:hypothetical protein